MPDTIPSPSLPRSATLASLTILMASPTLVAQVTEQPEIEAPPSPAEAPEPEPGGRPPEAMVVMTFAPTSRYTFPTNLDEPNGDVSVWRSGFDFRLTTPISRTARIVAGLSYEYSNYDFDAPNVFIPDGGSEPFSDIHILGGRLEGQFRIDDEWSWLAGGFGQFAGESGVDASDALSGGGLVAIQRTFSDGFTTSFGVLATSRLEDDALVIPAVTLDWQIDEQWRFSITGTRGELSYDFGDGLLGVLGGGWENRRFRLEEDSLSNGEIIEDEAVPVYLSLRLSPPDQKLQLSLTGGVMAYREFEVEDRHGDHGRTFDADPAGFAAFSIKLTF